MATATATTTETPRAGRPNGRSGGGKATELFPPFPDAVATAASSSKLAGLIGDDGGSDAGDGHDDDEDESAASSPVTSPPYWLHANAAGDGRAASNMNVSTESVAPITLCDNEAAAAADDADADADERRGSVAGRDRNRACWAKSVAVTDYVLVNGSATNIGAFAVWNIRVETLSVSSSGNCLRGGAHVLCAYVLWPVLTLKLLLQGSHMNIRKRYSEFDDFRRRLVFSFPNFEAAVPVLPPKSVVSRFRPRFLEKRRAGLQYFLKCVCPSLFLSLSASCRVEWKETLF